METILRGIRNVVSLGPKNACLHPRSAAGSGRPCRGDTQAGRGDGQAHGCILQRLWTGGVFRFGRRRGGRGVGKVSAAFQNERCAWHRKGVDGNVGGLGGRRVEASAALSRVLECLSPVQPTTRAHLLYSGPMAGRQSHTWGGASEGAFCGEAGLRPPTPF